MRNYWSPIPPPPPPPMPPPIPHKDCGEPIRGEIINGRLFPYGCVTEENYEADKSEILRNINEIEEKFENSVSTFDTAVTSLQSEISAIKTSDLADHEALSESIREIEEKVENSVSTFDSAVTSLQSEISEVKTNVSADCEALSESIREIEEKVENSVSTFDTAVTSLQSEISAIKTSASADHEALSESIREIEEKLENSGDMPDSSLSSLRNEISEIKTEVSEVKNNIPSVIISDSEPAVNNCIWLKPYVVSRVLTAMLELGEYTGDDYIAGIDNVDYGIKNTVRTESELTPTKYNFEITK